MARRVGGARGGARGLNIHSHTLVWAREKVVNDRYYKAEVLTCVLLQKLCATVQASRYKRGVLGQPAPKIQMDYLIPSSLRQTNKIYPSSTASHKVLEALSIWYERERHHTGRVQCDGAGPGDGTQPAPTHFASRCSCLLFDLSFVFVKRASA